MGQDVNDGLKLTVDKTVTSSVSEEGSMIQTRWFGRETTVRELSEEIAAA